jgi:hypothetical protein
VALSKPSARFPPKHANMTESAQDAKFLESFEEM